MLDEFDAKYKSIRVFNKTVSQDILNRLLSGASLFDFGFPKLICVA